MKTKLFFLTILFSFSFSNVKAQCPEGDVILLSQAEVNSFVANYPNCTHITSDLRFGQFDQGGFDINNVSGFLNITKVDGVLGIFGTDLVSLNGLNNINEVGSLNIVGNNQLISISEMINITELSNGQLQIAINPQLASLNGLNNIQEIYGRLYISIDMNSLTSLSPLNSLTTVGGLVNLSVPNITSLEGLDNLEYIGERLIIWGNTNLESLESLSSLTYVGGGISIGDNPNLSSLNGIQNFPISTDGEIVGLRLESNNSLSHCNLPNICDYLELNSTEYPREIFGNAGNCTDEQAVLAACGLGISDMENDSANWNVHYQKNTGGFLIQTNGFKMSEIEVYDLSGKLLKSAQNLNSDREEIRVFTPETILIIRVKTQEGKSFAKKVMMK